MGEEPDLDSVKQMMALRDAWGKAPDAAAKEAAWHKILELWTDQVFTIGIVSGVEQLVVVSNRLQNVPEKGTYNFEPGAYFGMYRPDTFWLTE
jgi:peptide/nickel transport system substrate-binding protein